jgi:hypothetical protein
MKLTLLGGNIERWETIQEAGMTWSYPVYEQVEASPQEEAAIRNPYGLEIVERRK